MADFVYTPAKVKLMSGQINLHTGGDDIRVILVSGDTTADTEQDAEFVGDITTLDECVATNYVRKELANEAVNIDEENNRAEFIGDPVTWTELGGETDDEIVGLVLYKHVDADDDLNPIIAHIDSGGFPKTTNGSDFKYTPNAEGILQAT